MRARTTHSHIQYDPITCLGLLGRNIKLGLKENFLASKTASKTMELANNFCLTGTIRSFSQNNVVFPTRKNGEQDLKPKYL